MEQFSLFDFTREQVRIDKPIRLIELFAGVGAQAMALRNLGADFEHYRVVEFDKYPVASYNAIHGTDFKPLDVTKIHGEDLGITEKEKYCYILTYSFPCTDLSVAGKQAGMARGSGTRSGLLWEVERLLNECGELPQILVMENVTAVHNEQNRAHFFEWLTFLEGKGYSNYWQDLNAADYGVPQHRDRTFCVSILGEYNYHFPTPIPLTRTMADCLEDEVDERYYINSEKALALIKDLQERGDIEVSQTVRGGGEARPTDTDGTCDTFEMNYSGIGRPLDEAHTIMALDYKGFGTSNEKQNGVVEWLRG